MPTPDPPMYLIGENLYLRPLDPRTDVDPCTRWLNDREVTLWLHRALPMTHAVEMAWVTTMTESIPDRDHVFAIVLKDAHRYIGNIGIHGVDWVGRTGTVGIVIGEKDCWGKGLSKEAALLLKTYAFHTINLRKLVATCLAPNTASMRLQLSIGFETVGRLREQHYRNGVYVDEVLLECFSGEVAKQ
jgi:[ribosomal protein S5]-alanine N-acetyltransferase